MADVTTPAYLTVPEAAALLRCHRDTVYALWHSGELRLTKVRGKTLVSRRELDRYLERQTRGPGRR